MRDICADVGVGLTLETGQETADDLAEMLTNLPGVYVNFDPANMILYEKGDPVKAVKTLAPWIRHIHIKDAKYAKIPGTWGEEVEWTKGEVNADAFIAALKEIGYDGCLAVDMRLAWLFGARGARVLPFCVTFRGCCTIRGCARRHIAYKSARVVAYKPQKWYNSVVSKPRYSSKIVVCKPQYGR